jgi:hypothetical protein
MSSASRRIIVGGRVARLFPSLDDWNLQSLNCMQAMLGVPSANFRRVTLDHDGLQWLIDFVLEQENTEDREEIDDFGAEWDALQDGPEPREVRIFVTADSLPWERGTKRVLYQRRESVAEQG